MPEVFVRDRAPVGMHRTADHGEVHRLVAETLRDHAAALDAAADDGDCAEVLLDLVELVRLAADAMGMPMARVNRAVVAKRARLGGYRNRLVADSRIRRG